MMCVRRVSKHDDHPGAMCSLGTRGGGAFVPGGGIPQSYIEQIIEWNKLPIFFQIILFLQLFWLICI